MRKSIAYIPILALALSLHAQNAPFNYDANGNLLVNVAAGGGAGGTSSTFGAAFPGTGTASGFKDGGGLMQPGLLDGSNFIEVDCKAGCSGGSADTTASGNLGALNNAVSISMAGINSASFTLPAANNLVGVLTPELSLDGGTTWIATNLRQASVSSNNFWQATLTVSSTAGSWNIEVPGGASNVRIRVSTYTSGTATAASVRGTQQPEAVLGSMGTAGNPIPPWVTVAGGSDGTNARALSTDSTGKLNVLQGAANWTVNLAQVAGTTTDTNSGNKSAGTLRVVLATDQPALTNKLLVTADPITFAAAQPVNISDGAGNALASLNSNLRITGSTASGATNLNNPVKVGGAFNTTQPTVTTGQTVDAQYTARGAALVATGVDAFTVAATESGTWTVNIKGNAGANFDAATGAAVPANALQVGYTDGTNLRAPFLDPCQSGVKTFINISQTANTRLLTGSASNRWYICSVQINAIGTATNIAFVEGTGSACATGTAAATGIGGGSGTAATGWQLIANQGFVMGSGGFSLGRTETVADDFCLYQSAANQISGGLTAVKVTY